MSTDNEPTVGELARGLQAVLDRFEDLIRRIEVNYVTKDVFTLTQEMLKTADGTERDDRSDADRELSRRVDRLESNQTWLVRVVIGAVVVALLGLVLAGKAKGAL